MFGGSTTTTVRRRVLVDFACRHHHYHHHRCFDRRPMIVTKSLATNRSFQSLSPHITTAKRDLYFSCENKSSIVYPSFRKNIIGHSWSHYFHRIDHRSFSSSTIDDDNSTTTTIDFSIYYKIEANNAARSDATQLTVSGPDMDGILASMTVALALKGCSLVELHAAKSVDMASVHHYLDDHGIHDVFYVVERGTGRPFNDDDLEPLAKSLLESLKKPMPGMVGGSSGSTPSIPLKDSVNHDKQPQISIIKSTDLK